MIVQLCEKNSKMKYAKKLILLLLILSTNANQFISKFPNKNHQINYNENTVAVKHPQTCNTRLHNYQHCLCGICKNLVKTRNPSAEAQLLRKEFDIVENALSVLKDDVSKIKNAPPGDKALF